MIELKQDFFYALRMLGRGRGVTVVAVIALALGIGANTAIFSVVNTLLLKPLSYPDQDRLVQIWGSTPARNIPFHNVFYRDAVEWRRQSRSLETLVAAQQVSMNLVAGGGEAGEAERVQGWRASAQFLPMLGARLKLGRHLQAGEDVLNAPRVTVLNHGLWQRRFGGHPGVIGRTIQLDGTGHTVVGVLEPGFNIVGRNVDAVVPLAFAESGPSSTNTVTTFGKLRPGVGVQQAQAELSTIGQRLEGQTIGRSPVVWGMREFAVRAVKPGLLMLLCAVGLVLLIACANVANILLARAGAREREMAVRCAMGAVRGRLVRQLLTESCLLALAGGVAGLLLAWWGVATLPKLAPAGYPMLADVALDWRVLLATLAISLATGVAFGLAPALTLSGGRALHESLKEGGRGGGDTVARGRLRSALVVSEVALAMLLAVGAGLLIRSFGNLSGVNPGFNAAGLLTAQVSLPRGTSAARRRAFYDDLLRKIETTPGVRACGLTSILPLTAANTGTGMFVEGRPVARPEDAPLIWFRSATPGYFPAMAIPLKRGRLLTPADATTDAPPVALINETAARRFWPDEDPVGKRFANGPPRADRPPTVFTVAGVVGDLRHQGLNQEPEPEMFLPSLDFNAQIGDMVVVRTDAAGTRFGLTLRGIVASLDRTVPVSGIRSGEQLLSDSIAAPRFSTTLLALFAALAVTLAAVGVYGVISYSVARRTREIGIRMALGARAGDVVAMVVGQALALAAVGVVIGLAAAAALGRSIRTMLFGVSAFDPAIYATLAVVVTLVAGLAAFVPARRAARVDPTVALRYE